MKQIYPTNYNAEDIALYDEFVSKGKLMLGDKIKYEDNFLIDMAAKMSIYQIRNAADIENMTDEDVAKCEEQRLEHLHTMMQPVHETPIDLFEKGQHPLELNKVVENLEHNIEKKIVEPIIEEV